MSGDATTGSTRIRTSTHDGPSPRHAHVDAMDEDDDEDGLGSIPRPIIGAPVPLTTPMATAPTPVDMALDDDDIEAARFLNGPAAEVVVLP